MGVRDAMNRHGERLANLERKAGRLPDSRQIERQVQSDFNGIKNSIKPGKSHPMADRGGERK